MNFDAAHRRKLVRASERIYKSRKEFDKRTSFYDSLWIRHMAAYRYVAPYVRNKTVLDVGCGSGYGAFCLSRLASQVVAVDVSREAIDYSRTSYYANNLQWMVMDGSNLSFENNSFDILVSFQTIEHVMHVEHYLSEARRVSETFIVSTPNRKKYERGNPFHVTEFCFGDLRSLLRRHFSRVRMFGINSDTEFSGLSKKVTGIESLFDKVHLRTIISLIPDRLKKALSAYIAPIGLSAFNVQDASEECLDLLAVCQR